MSDTGPLNYLVLIGLEQALPRLFDEVLIPAEVLHELTDRRAPEPVRAWIARPPAWLTIVRHPSAVNRQSTLHAGELAVLQLAKRQTSSCVVLIDDLAARAEAEAMGLEVSGTLAALFDASRAGHLDFSDAVLRLRKTSFRMSRRVREAFLTKWSEVQQRP